MVRQGVVLLLPLAFVAAIFACNNGTQIDHPCTDIPDGGCPLADGLSCDDPACAAVYLCREGNVWELDKTCPLHAPSDAAVVDASFDADAADTGKSPISDAAIDAPAGAYGGPGCVELELGDCPLGLALACSSSCCGCDDLYVCNAGNWNFWGYCGPNGPVYSPQKN